MFANRKADPQHRPKYRTCLIRIPNTLNSKCLDRGLDPEESKVMIIQKWNAYRLPIQSMTREFRIWITPEEVNEKLDFNSYQKIKESLRNAKNYKPVSLEKLKETNAELYAAIR